jgi:hypothetical protein
MAKCNIFWYGAIARFSTSINITCRNKDVCYSHTWSHTFGSSKLIYLCEPRFIVYTICLVNFFASRWFHKVVQWSIDVFSHDYWNSPWNFVPWLVNTSTRVSNYVNTLSKNADVVFSLLQYANDTNFSLFEKCSIIAKTYKLCCTFKPNGRQNLISIDKQAPWWERVVNEM